MKKRKPGTAINIAVAVFMIFCLVTVFKLKIELDELSRVKEELQSDIEESEAYVRRLENRLGAAFNEDYVVGVAKDKLNLVLPEEIIFYNDLVG